MWPQALLWLSLLALSTIVSARWGGLGLPAALLLS
jgi:hypothetical protein